MVELGRVNAALLEGKALVRIIKDRLRAMQAEVVPAAEPDALDDWRAAKLAYMALAPSLQHGAEGCYPGHCNCGLVAKMSKLEHFLENLDPRGAVRSIVRGDG